jgi:hypothetical protein
MQQYCIWTTDLASILTERNSSCTLQKCQTFSRTKTHSSSICMNHPFISRSLTLCPTALIMLSVGKQLIIVRTDDYAALDLKRHVVLKLELCLQLSTSKYLLVIHCTWHTDTQLLVETSYVLKSSPVSLFMLNSDVSCQKFIWRSVSDTSLNTTFRKLAAPLYWCDRLAVIILTDFHHHRRRYCRYYCTFVQNVGVFTITNTRPVLLAALLARQPCSKLAPFHR